MSEEMGTVVPVTLREEAVQAPRVGVWFLIQVGQRTPPWAAGPSAIR